MSQGESVTESAVKGTGYALIVVTSLVVIARFAGLVRRLKDLKAEDYLLLVAYALFIELSVLYIIITPAVFRLAALQKGLIAPYPTVEQDGHQMQIFMFVTTISLWLCLWMIKFSLLSMYKRFLSGKAYIVAWWTIITCCALVGVSVVEERTDLLVPHRSHPFRDLLLLKPP